MGYRINVTPGFITCHISPMPQKQTSLAPAEEMKLLSMSPATALDHLNLEQTQNIKGFQSLLTILAHKLPEHLLQRHDIVIVGLRGVGKSTLALMALAALGFRLLDVEKCVSEHVGMPEAVYLQKVSIEQYQQLQYELVTQAVDQYTDDSKIIVMPLTIINSEKLLQYLKSGKFKFIVNVECEEERILKYLNFEGKQESGISLVQRKFASFRHISTHDFYNSFSQSLEWKRNLISIGREEERDLEETSYFKLKPVEREFIKFLTFLIRGPAAATASAGNLHLRSTFFHNYTNCLKVSAPHDLEKISEEDFIGIDCIELSINMVELIKHDLSASKLTLSAFISKLRRLSTSSIPVLMSIENTLAEANLFVREVSISSSREIDLVRSDLKSYYLTLLGSAIRLGVDFLSIDLNLCRSDSSNFFLDSNTSTELLFELCQSLVSNRGSTEIIGTVHSNNSDFWESGAFAALDLASALKINIVRLSSTASTFLDNTKIASFHNQMRNLAQYEHLTVCAYNKGPLGRISKVLNKHFTPVDAERCFDESSDTITAKRLLIAHFSSYVIPNLRFYIMGQRVSKSISPLVHGEAYKAIGLSYQYYPLECDNFWPNFQKLMSSPNFGGTAIIMPFKLEALQYVDTMSNHVKVIGALNTVIAQRDANEPNKITGVRGENTDWLGVRITLQDSTSPINAMSSNKTALVIGAGGMSRSAIYALIQLGYENILLYNRTRGKAETLAAHYNKLSPLLPSKCLTTGELCDSKKDLKYFRVHVLLQENFINGNLPPEVNLYPTSIVSCVPSSNPQTGELTNIPVSGRWFSSPTGGVALETGYDPLTTPILETARSFSQRGWNAVNGLNWLLAQAIAQFEMFTGKQAPVALMKEVVSKIYNQRT